VGVLVRDHGKLTAMCAEVADERPARFSGGVELTEELLDQLAEEAAEGYDVTRILPRGSRHSSSSQSDSGS
jgi:hypothetical protein